MLCDSTNEVLTNIGCVLPTFNPFWKRPKDSTNKTAKSTGAQIKNKPYATRKYMKKYSKYVTFLKFNKDTQWSDYRTDCSIDCSSESETESEKLWLETGQDLVTDLTPNSEAKQQTPTNKETNNKEIPAHN